jgi:hypothetical protein
MIVVVKDSRSNSRDQTNLVICPTPASHATKTFSKLDTPGGGSTNKEKVYYKVHGADGQVYITEHPPEILGLDKEGIPSLPSTKSIGLPPQSSVGSNQPLPSISGGGPAKSPTVLTRNIPKGAGNQQLIALKENIAKIPRNRVIGAGNVSISSPQAPAALKTASTGMYGGLGDGMGSVQKEDQMSSTAHGMGNKQQQAVRDLATQISLTSEFLASEKETRRARMFEEIDIRRFALSEVLIQHL